MWTGSANATTAAFDGNVELLVELVGPRKRFGISALMESSDELRFGNLLVPAESLVGLEPVDPAVEALEHKLDKIRCAIADAGLEVHVTSTPQSTFNLEVRCGDGAEVAIDRDVSATCWLPTVSSTTAVAFRALSRNNVVAAFSALPFQSITAFVAFEVSGRAGGEERRVRFALNLPLIGAPEARREQILRSLVQDRTRMLRFLILLLADEGLVLQESAAIPGAGDGIATHNAPSQSSNGLFEMLLRNLDRAPERLDHLSSLLKELRRGEDGEDLMPAGFDEIWDPIWRQRERLRARSRA